MWPRADRSWYCLRKIKIVWALGIFTCIFLGLEGNSTVGLGARTLWKLGENSTYHFVFNAVGVPCVLQEFICTKGGKIEIDQGVGTLLERHNCCGVIL